MPWAAAEVATPAGRSLQSTAAAWRPGPGHEADEPVEEHRPRGAGQRAGRAGEEHAQALADDPDAEHPGERHGQRGAHRAPEEQADADEELDQREERVPHRDVGRHEVPDVGDEVAEDEGLPAGVGQDDGLHEAAAEHEGLELQRGIEDPEEAEDDLQGPLRTRTASGKRRRAPAASLVRCACPGRCPCPALRYRRPCGWPCQGSGSGPGVRAARSPGQCSSSASPPRPPASR